MKEIAVGNMYDASRFCDLLDSFSLMKPETEDLCNASPIFMKAIQGVPLAGKYLCIFVNLNTISPKLL